MRSCSTCLHHFAEPTGQMVCRFSPPMAFALPKQNVLGQVGISIMSAFPPVSAEMSCSKHVELKAFDLAAKVEPLPVKSSLIMNGR